MTGESSRINTDFFITYHHSDEMAARWIAAVLKQARFSTLSDSWDFLPGEAPHEKIEHMFTAARKAMVLISNKFLQYHGDLFKSFCGGPGGGFLEKSPLVAEGNVFFVRIEPFDIESVFGTVEYIDLAGIKESEAVKRLLAAIRAAGAVQKETETLPVSVPAVTPVELLAQRKQELEKLLDSCIKHNYHMKLDLEQEVEKVVEVKNEKTGEMEKRKEWVWEQVSLDTVLKDGKNYILVNPSGMGKTTFLTYVADALLDQEAHYPFLPLFFTCIGLNNRADTFEDFIQRQVDSVYTSSHSTLVSGDWENLCVLIDALDQARDVDDIVSSLLLHDKPLHYKKAKIILSSRQNTADKVKEGFAKIRLKLPEEDEVQHYLGEENYQKLAGIIDASGELVKAPVLLEMLKTITEKEHFISTLHNRADLYTEFTKVLLDQERSKPRFWQDRLSIRHFIDFELEQVLEKLAFFSLADNEILEIPKEKLAQYCESPVKTEALLNIGILLELFENREQKIVFRHQSFQAYFAARYMYYRQPELFQELVSDIAFFYNDVWYEVMRFFVGLEKGSQKVGKIIEALLKNDSSPNGLKKIIRWISRKFKRYDLTAAIRLIFSFFLLSESQVNSEMIHKLRKQMRYLLLNNTQYFDFLILNINKFNKSNAELRRSLFVYSASIFKRYVAQSITFELLEKIGTANDIPILEPLLSEKYIFHRINAISVLGKIGTAEHIPLLKPLLRDEDSYVRITAIEVLGKIGTAEHIPLLEPLLRDKYSDIRRDAANVLGKIGTPEHIHLLEPLLRDKVSYVRNAAVAALGNIGVSKDIPLLEPLLMDKDKYIRSATTGVLGKIGTSEHIPLLEPLLRDEDKGVRQVAIKVLEKIGTAEHIPLLEPLLRDEDKWVRRDATEALGKIGTSKDIHLLIPLLRDKSSAICEAANDTLKKIVKLKDIYLLKPLLGDKDAKVWYAAADALKKIVKLEDIPFLKPLLNDEDINVRYAVTNALEKIVTLQDTPFLKQLLSDKDHFLILSIAQLLENIYKKIEVNISIVRDIHLLEPLLKDNNEYIRRAAVKAMKKIATTKDLPLLEPLLSDEEWIVRQEAAATLGYIGTTEHIPLLVPLFRDEISFIRCAAIEALGNVGTSKDIPFLEPLLRDEYFHVRSAAVKTLGNIGTVEHVPLLEPLISDEDWNVRRAAAETLGKIGTAKDIPLLEPLLSDESKAVRWAAAEALGSIGTSANIPLLEQLFKDEEFIVRLAAAKVMSLIGTSEHILLLKPLLSDEEWIVRYAATSAFEKIITAKDIPLLELMVRDVDEEVKNVAFEILEKICTSEHIAFLGSLLRDEDGLVKSYTARVLKKIVTIKDIPFLEPLLRDKDDYVRRNATEALGKIGTAKDIPLLEPLLRDEHRDVRCAAAEVLGIIGTKEHIPLLDPLLKDEVLKDQLGRPTAVEAFEKILKRSTPKLCIDRVLPKKKEKKALSVRTFSGLPLHILQISDIHYALEKHPTITCIFHEFLEDINKWRSQQNHTNIQAICLTGDIAASGQNEQYDLINEKINALLETTGCPKENLFIIPGNHDVQDYDQISPQGKSLLEQIRDNRINIDTGVLSNADHYRQFHDKFTNFYRYIENAGYLNSLPDNHPHNPKPWFNRKLKDFPVRIMGLNSALFCLKLKDLDFSLNQYGHLRMGTHQFQEAYFHGKGNASDRRDQESVILLTHHPLNWLAESEHEDYSTLLERYAVIHLHGHIHKTKIEKKQKLFSSSGGYVSIGTGSLYGEKGKEDINTYHIITFDFENQEIHVWARRWNPDSGKWTVYDDDGNNRFPLPVKR